MLVGVGLFIRLKIIETPSFSRVKETHTEARMPIVDVFRAYPKPVLLAAGARFADNVLYYVFATFVLTYTTAQLGLPRSAALVGVLIAAALELATMRAFGALSDRIGRRPVIVAGTLAMMLLSFPCFWLVDTGSTFLIWVAIMLALAVSHAAVFGPIAAFFAELFSTRVRYSGTSVGFQLGSLSEGAPTPFIATALLAWSGGSRGRSRFSPLWRASLRSSPSSWPRRRSGPTWKRSSPKNVIKRSRPLEASARVRSPVTRGG